MRTAARLALAPLLLPVKALGLGLRVGSARLFPLPAVTSVPEGRLVDLPGRGRTYVFDVPGPHPDAPTVLLLHGLATTSHLTWFTTIEHLSAHYRVVGLDLPWHGRGTRAERFLLDDCADDAAAVLDALGVEQAVVAGYSLGGAVAQVLWRRHPDLVAGLVLCSTAAAWAQRRGERVFYPALDLALRPWSRRVHGAVAQHVTTLPEVPLCDLSDISAWGLGELRSTSLWSVPVVMSELGRFSSAAWLADVDVPTAVVVTERDAAVPAERQHALAEAIPGARTFRAPGGHTSLMLDLARWQPIFLEAVADVAGRSPRPHRRCG